MYTAALALIAALATTQTSPRAAAYWQDIVARDFAVPAGATAPALAAELDVLLAHPDPVLRDDLATTILSRWIERRVLAPAELRGLMTGWLRAIDATDLPASGTVRRSFSALMLATLVTRDNAEPFLTPGELTAIQRSAVAYLTRETDLRGYDERIGWVHAAAHTADLLRALGRSRTLPASPQAEFLDAIGRRLTSAPVVFTFGEDERLARAVSVLLIRDDFALEPFKAWVTSITAPSKGPLSTGSLNATQNVKNMLAKLGVLLARQPTLPPNAAAARDAVLMAVRF